MPQGKSTKYNRIGSPGSESMSREQWSARYPRRGKNHLGSDTAKVEASPVNEDVCNLSLIKRTSLNTTRTCPTDKSWISSAYTSSTSRSLVINHHTTVAIIASASPPYLTATNHSTHIHAPHSLTYSLTHTLTHSIYILSTDLSLYICVSVDPSIRVFTLNLDIYHSANHYLGRQGLLTCTSCCRPVPAP